MKFGALRICIIYVAFSLLWITLSDKALFLMEANVPKSTLLILSSGKGYLFVVITGLLFYKLIKIDELRLKESEKKYRTMYEGNPLPMWIYDLTTLKFVSINSAAVKIYGYSEEEFLRKTTLDIRPPEDIPKALEAINQIRADSLTSSEWTHIKADGTRMTVNVNSQKLMINNRPHIMVIAKDITEKVAFEKELKMLNRKLQDEKRKLSDTQLLAKLGGWIFYLAEKRLEWSDELYKITDHTPQPNENLFNVYLAHIYPEDRPAMIKASDTLLKTGKGFDVTHRIRLHNGQTRYIHHVARLEYAEGKPDRVVGSLQDITDLKERELRIAHQNKMLQDIAWVNSHEVRGPVASILGLFNLYNEASTQEEKDNIIKMINTCAVNLDRMVKDIADKIDAELGNNN